MTWTLLLPLALADPPAGRERRMRFALPLFAALLSVGCVRAVKPGEGGKAAATPPIDDEATAEAGAR